MDIVRYVQLAEQLGFERVWTYDSPALYGDIWVALARIAPDIPRELRRFAEATGLDHERR